MKKILSLLVFMIMGINCALADIVKIKGEELSYGTYNMYGGTIKYEDAGTYSRLTLENVTIDGCLELFDDIEVRVSGNNTINNSFDNGIKVWSSSNVSIVSEGAGDVLNVKSTKNAIYIGKHCVLNIGSLDNILTLNLRGREYGIYGDIEGDYWSRAKLYITKADVNIYESKNKISVLQELTLNDCVLTGGAKIERDRTFYFLEYVGDVHIVAVKEYYDLKVNGEVVNSATASDVLGDGTVSYDSASKKLTLIGAIIITNLQPAIESGINGLTIELLGKSQILSYSTSGTLYCRAPFSLTGAVEGARCLIYNEVGAAIVNEGASMTISDLYLQLFGKTVGIQGRNTSDGNASLNIENSTLMIDKTEVGAIIGESSISMNEETIATPYKGTIKNGTLLNADNTICKSVARIYPGRFCGIWVGGTPVTNKNADNVLSDEALNNNKVSYDEGTKTLTLNNTWLPNRIQPAIESSVKGLTIKVKGLVALGSSSYDGAVCSTAGDFSIIPMDANAECNIEGTSGAPCIVNEACRASINGGEYGVKVHLISTGAGIRGKSTSAGDAGVVIENATVNIDATQQGAITGQSYISLNGEVITSPYNASVKDGMLVDCENTVCKDKVEIVPGESYGIWFRNTVITNNNASDVCGDGKVSYNVGTKTLTLDGCMFSVDAQAPAIGSSVDGLTINMMGKNSLTSGSPKGVIHSSANFTITSEGTGAHVTIYNNTSDGPCIVNEACNVRIEGIDVDLFGASGVQGKCTSQGDASLYISKSVVVYRGEGQVVSGQKKVTLDDNEVVKLPYYAVVKNGTVVDDNGKPVKGEVTFSPGQQYDIMVAGRQVNEFNMHDIMHEGKNGVQYDPETNVLSVHGVNIETDELYAIRSNVKGINIQFDGGEVLTATRGSGIVLTYDGSITSLSPDPVTINAFNAGIAAGQTATVTLGDGKQPFSLNINSKTCGIQGTESPWVHSLKLDNATLSIAPTTHGAITGFSDIDLGGFNIVQDGARILNGSVINYDGTRYCNQLDIIRKYDIWLCGVRVTGDNCNDILGDGKAAYDPKAQTLTLTGTVRCDSGDLLMADGNLVLHGTVPVSLISTDGYCIYGLGGDITIEGMNLTCESDCETVYMEGVGALQIFESSATFSSASSSALSLCDNDLFLSSSIVNVRGNGQEQTIDGCQNLKLDACILTSDNYYDASTRHFYNNASGEIETGDVTFTVKGESKPFLYVKGEPVNVRNAGDILHDGSMSYDAETKTLTLHGGQYVAGIWGFIKPLDDITIVCEAEVSVMVGMASSFVDSEHDVTFRSGYPVNLSGIGGTVFNLYGNLTLDVEEMTLIQGTDLLYANGEGGLTVDATGHPTSIKMYGRSAFPFVLDCLWIDLKECEFTSGEYNSRKQQIVGSTITDESAYYKYEATITSTAMPDAIGNVTPATHEAQAIYDLQGRRIPATQAKHGLYIIDGRKVMR